MPSRLLRYTAFLLLFIVPAFMDFAAAAGADPQPVEILTGIYKEAVKGNTANWLDPNRRGKFLSRSLAALWAKADKKDPDDPFDWDLTTDTNGLDLQDFVITTKSRTDSAAVLAVKLIYRKPYVLKGPPRVVTYDFIREDGRWRIDGMHGLDWSVRDLLELRRKPPTARNPGRPS
jgi:hypothetical protein